MERFKKIYKQGVLEVVEIWVDTETGVNYIFHRYGVKPAASPYLWKI